MLLASALQALAVAWPRGETRARPALHIATLHDPSDQATKLDKRESFSKPRERPIFFITTFQVIWRDSRAERIK